MTNRYAYLTKLITGLLLVMAMAAPTVHSQTAAETQDLSEQDRAVPADQRLWLDDGSKDLAFYIPEKSGKAHGGVLIIPNRGEHPGVLGLINTLRYTLAENHWHTLALNISGQDADAIQNTIAAGIVSLNGKGVFNIALLGEGEGALHALRYVASLPPAKQGEVGQIRALVMINATNNSGGRDDALTKLGSITLPVLDAYYANDLDELKQAQERKRFASPQSELYQQARLPYTNTQSSPTENRITKRVRGWLDKNAAGFMVDSSSPSMRGTGR